MKTVRLVHWNDDEGLERREQLEAFELDTALDFGDGAIASDTKIDPMSALRKDWSAGVRAHGRTAAHTPARPNSGPFPAMNAEFRLARPMLY